MNRRHLIKAAMASGVLAGLPVFGSVAHPVLRNRVLVDVMLPGGPDFRHLMPPPFEPDTVGYHHWKVRASAHNISNAPAAWKRRWNQDYFHLSDGQTTFGLLKKAGWLKKMWDAGMVAIVNNVVGGTSRDHAHCQMIKNQGNLSSGPNDFGRPGWGGRLVSVAGGNVLALTPIPLSFCFGPDPQNPEGHSNANVIVVANSRKIRLYHPPPGRENSYPGRIARSLKAYYAAKRQEMAPNSIYRRFVEMEAQTRFFGEAIEQRLKTMPLPASIEGLFTKGSANSLRSKQFGGQIRNLYDSLVCSDIVDIRVASMSFGGWDTHKNQRARIEANLEDMFGIGKAFDTLFQELPVEVADKLVFLIGGEFGRQLKANGNNGTDHGQGTSFFIIGNGVKGGVIGEMFPEGELDRLEKPSPDIRGLTEYDHIFGALCEWVSPGSSRFVFPNQAAAKLEKGVNLSRLFR